LAARPSMLIISRAAKASRLRAPLSSNVRQRRSGLAVLQQSQRLRRELRSHEAAKPRERRCLHKRTRRQTTAEARSAPNHRTLLEASSGTVNAAANNSYLEPLWHIEPFHCVGGFGFLPVRRAAATNAPLATVSCGGLNTWPTTAGIAEREDPEAWHAR
jgi:hypothetical protein